MMRLQIPTRSYRRKKVCHNTTSAIIGNDVTVGETIPKSMVRFNYDNAGAGAGDDNGDDNGDADTTADSNQAVSTVLVHNSTNNRCISSRCPNKNMIDGSENTSEFGDCLYKHELNHSSDNDNDNDELDDSSSWSSSSSSVSSILSSTDLYQQLWEDTMDESVTFNNNDSDNCNGNGTNEDNTNDDKQQNRSGKSKGSLLSTKSLQHTNTNTNVKDDCWKQLQNDFIKRDSFFNKITTGKNKINTNSTFIRQLKQREIQVRKIRIQKLIRRQQHQHNNNPRKLSRSTDNDTFPVEFQHLVTDSTYQKRSMLTKLYDVLVFISYTTIPAIIGAVSYSIAHSAFYEVLYYTVDQFKNKVIEVDLPSTISNCIFYMTLLVIGTALMYITGDLFWFLNKDKYNCIKFDFDNRCFMQQWDALLMKRMRSNTVTRFLLFTIGYNFVYISSYQFYVYLATFFDQKSTLLLNLPSRLNFDTQTSTWDTIICQHEINRIENERNDRLQEDMTYTWNTLTHVGYEAYWIDWLHNMEAGYTLFNFVGQIRFNLIILAIFVIIPYMYGLVLWVLY